MKRIFSFVTALIFALLVGVQFQLASAQDVIRVGGKNYQMHRVENSETLFSIARKYEVSQNDLIEANPLLSKGLKSGETIRIPLKQAVVPAPKGASQSEFITHTVKKGETVFSISQLYGMAQPDLVKCNPGIDSELNEGDLLRVPRKTQPESLAQQAVSQVTEDAKYYYHTIEPGENPSALTRRYNIRIQEFYASNPETKERFHVGDVVRIPKNVETAKPIESAYFWREIEAGDTFYSYERKFGVSQKELLELNPELADGLPVGLKIKIPTAHLTKNQIDDKDLVKYAEYVVKKGDTMYGLSTRFGMTEDQLREINPVLKTREPQLGETILTPKGLVYNTSSQTTASPVRVATNGNVPFENKTKSVFRLSTAPSDTFTIALFLPLYVDKHFLGGNTSESDQSAGTNGVAQQSLYRASRNFVSFYEGFILGLDSIRRQGARIKLQVYDTQSGSNFFDKAQRNGGMSQVDLIVGPVDVAHQKAVAQFALKNQIPMVSPLSASDSLTFKNAYYFQVAATKKYTVRKTAEYIGNAFYKDNVVLLKLGGTLDADELQSTAIIREKLKSTASQKGSGSVSLHEIEYGGSAANIRNVLKKDQLNVVHIQAPSNRNSREVALTKAINALQVLASEYKIVLVGYSDYLRSKSINTEYFHKLSFTYLTSSHVDYSDLNVNRFIRSYRNEFVAEPNQFSFRGFDVATHFAQAYMNYGKSYYRALDEFSTSLLQVDFNFKRTSDNGGYMNQGLQVVRLSPDFKVEVVSKYNNGKFFKLK